MTTTPTSDETPSAFTDEQYGAQRAEAAMWAGASAMITDRRGRVLTERVGYRDTRLLPGGAVDKGESPAQAASPSPNQPSARSPSDSPCPLQEGRAHLEARTPS